MRKPFLFNLLLLAIPLMLGMGPLQGQGTLEKIPTPVKNYTATFVDQMDVVTECAEVIIDGNTFLEGKRGEGNYTVSFDNIQQMVLRMNAERLTGHLMLRDGGTIELVLNKDKKVYGRTNYGTFQIKLADLKKVLLNAVQHKK